MTHCAMLAPGHALLLFSHLPSLGMLGPETREQQISALITKSKQEKNVQIFSQKPQKLHYSRMF